MGYIFNNGFGGKMPGLIFQGNNGAYGGHGFAADTGYAPWSMANPTYVLRDDVSKTIGKHTIQFGVEATLAQQNELSAVSGANSGDMQGSAHLQQSAIEKHLEQRLRRFSCRPRDCPGGTDIPTAAGLTAQYGGRTTAIKSFHAR